MRLPAWSPRLTVLAAVACGIIASFTSGLLENPPIVGLPEYRFYGYPLVWRVSDLAGSSEFIPTNFAIDTGFWIALFLLVAAVLAVRERRFTEIKAKKTILLLVLLVPLGLVMDFIHEAGHALWGTAFGGTLTYMKIAYVEIYPRLALTPHFALGEVNIAGLPNESAQGIMLLGGALTTNIISWLLALIILQGSFGKRLRTAMTILGIIGVLDLPFYVLFPQLGLRHWIVIGGCQPEPLIGARKIGIPDAAFYASVILTTLGLTLLYSKSVRERARSFWEMTVTKTRTLARRDNHARCESTVQLVPTRTRHSDDRRA